MRLSWVLFCFMLFCSVAVKAQDSLLLEEKQVQYDATTNLNPINFNTDKIADLKNEPSFDYLRIIKNDSWWTRVKRWVNTRYQQFTDWLFGDYKAYEFVAVFLKILPFLILGAFIGLIIWLFIRLIPARSLLEEQEGPQVFLNNEENIVRSENIGKLIEAAINDGDYRLAVRYYYLQLLRQLNQKKLINYEFQKTNSEYLNEIKADRLRAQLKKVMRIYDFIWYGSFSLTEPDFHLAQSNFQDLQTSIKIIPDE